MNRTLGLVCATLLSLGVVSLACSSGEVVQGPAGGENGGGAGSTGVAGSNPTGVAGSNPTGVAGSNPTGVAGSSSKGGSTGVAGSSSKGGSTGAAGSTSSKGGSTGVAGSGSGVAGSNPTGVAGSGNVSGATTCAMGLSNPPQTALITDFSDLAPDASNAGEFKYGATSVSAQGGTSRFASGTKGTLADASGALKFTATVEAPSTANMYPYNGFSIYVNGPGCVDAKSGGYIGISFKISALTGTCPLELGFSDSAHTPASADPDRGTAPAGSYAAGFAVTTATTSVNFTTTPTSAGSPAAAPDGSKIIGLQFQFKPVSSTATTSCMGSVTIDDIKFTK